MWRRQRNCGKTLVLVEFEPRKLSAWVCKVLGEEGKDGPLLSELVLSKLKLRWCDRKFG